jgi:hypothetical protein
MADVFLKTVIQHLHERRKQELAAWEIGVFIGADCLKYFENVRTCKMVH